jgi:hypothetical protein
MTTTLDRIIDAIKEAGFHNHRKEGHSDTLALGILEDLKRKCAPLRDDLKSGEVKSWINVAIPGRGERKLDLLIAGARDDAPKLPDLGKVRICVENKSVVTAHRNKTERFKDLQQVLAAVHRAREEAVLVATVLVGTAERVLNVPDRVKPFVPPGDFETKVVPRLSSGDVGLWKEFPAAISKNRLNDPLLTVERFRGLPVRQLGHTHILGYDFVLLVPAFIDNVNPPYLARKNNLGIDIDKDYRKMLDHICKAYRTRWHL